MPLAVRSAKPSEPSIMLSLWVFLAGREDRGPLGALEGGSLERSVADGV